MRKKEDIPSFDFSLIGEETPLIINNDSFTNESIRNDITSSNDIIKEPVKKRHRRTKAEMEEFRRSQEIKNEKSKDEDEIPKSIIYDKMDVQSENISIGDINLPSMNILQLFFEEQINNKWEKGKSPSVEGYLNMAYRDVFQMKKFHEKLKRNIDFNQKIGTLKTAVLWMKSMCDNVEMAMQIAKYHGDSYIEFDNLYEKCSSYRKIHENVFEEIKSKMKKKDI